MSKRVIALIIDSVLVSLVSSVVLTPLNLGSNYAVLLIISLAYYALMEAYKGATLGKMIMKIKVVTMDGNNIDMQQSLIRNVLRIVDFLPFAYILGFIVAQTNPNKQRIGDMAAKTRVVAA